MSSPTFLTLPPKIRLKIYLFADLVRLCPLSLNNEGSRKAYREQSLTEYEYGQDDDDDVNINWAMNRYCDYRTKKFNVGFQWRDTAEKECICPPLPIQLLTVCRSIYEEVFEILYFQNKFKVFLEGNFPLAPKAVAQMTSLCIRLNMCSCVPHHFCQYPLMNHPGARCYTCHTTCKRGMDPPLSITSTLGVGIVSRWTEVCKILQSGLGPGMRLSIICDCEDMVTAQKIVEPMKEFPKLSECSIRLGQSSAMESRKIAEDTVLFLVDRPPTTSLHLPDLPGELLRNILCYTDLISPYVLEWNSYDSVYHQQRGIKPFEQFDRICCMQCTDAGEACCCAVNHAAFSSVQCTCWSYPAALFRVSRDIRHDATVLFYSRNRFVIQEIPWPVDQQPGMCKALTLLQRLPSLALRNIRWIRFNLGQEKLDIHKGSTPLTGWKETGQFIAQNLETSNLTVELDLRYGLDTPDVYNPETAEDRENHWKSYQNMAEVFIFNDGLKDFFVHLASPHDWPATHDPRLRMKRERILEKRIMGPEYDGDARGKYSNRGVSLSDAVCQQTPFFAPDGSLASCMWVG